MDIKKIKEGQKVTEPGFYRMPMVWYHSDCCPGPSVSSSGLRQVTNECPAEFWAFSYLNPKAYPTPEKAAWVFGRAAHCLLLGDEVFKEHFAVRPREWTDWRKDAAKQWRDAIIEAGKAVLTPADLTHIGNMAAELSKHPLAATLVEGEVEVSLIWQDRETGLWCKARPDVLPLSGVISDFKKTSRGAKPEQCFRVITDYGYHQQLALIAEGFETLTGNRPSYASLIFQQDSPPYHVTPIEISEEALEVGRIQNRSALRTIARGLKDGHWPSYTEEIPVFHLPDWYRKRVEMTLAAE